MRNRLLLTLSAIVIVVAFSCKNKAGNSGLLVPSDAIVVAHINSASLISKLSWDDIKQSKWFMKMAEEKTDSFSRELMNDPEASGIDLKGEGFTFFLKKQGTGGYSIFQGDLKDAAAFEKFLQETHGGNLQVAKSGDVNYVKAGDHNLVTWTSKHFMFTSDVPLAEMNPLARMYGNGERREGFSTDSLLLFTKATYALSGDALLDNNSRFSDLMKSSGDAHLYFSAENLYNTFTGGMMSMMKVTDLIKDNVSTATLNFENGKITVDGHQYMNKTLSDLISKYAPKDVPTETINRLPSGEVMFAMTYNFPIEGIVEIFKIAGVDGFMNGMLGEKKLSLADFASAFTGEMAFAIPQLSRKEVVTEYNDYEGKPQTSHYTKTGIDYVGGLGIKNQPAFDKIWNVIMGEMKDDMPKDMSIKNENKWLSFGNNDTATGSFLAGNNKPAYAGKLSGHPFGMYVNINRIIASQGAEEHEPDSTEKAMMDLSLATWQDATMYADYKNGEAVSKIEINLSDKNMNSLKQINQFADKMFVIQDNRRKKMEEQWNLPRTDTTEAPKIEQK